MQIIVNEQGFVQAYALIGSFGANAVEVIEPENLVDFEENYRSYCISADGILIKDDSKQAEIVQNRILAELRVDREKECFKYINRGELWYERLSDSQKEDLRDWYENWLNVTETKIKPIAPEWLDTI